MWTMLLHLHVNLNADDDDDYLPPYFRTLLRGKKICSSTSNLIITVGSRNDSIHVHVGLKVFKIV